jgi:hypothetical protein
MKRTEICRFVEVLEEAKRTLESTQDLHQVLIWEIKYSKQQLVRLGSERQHMTSDGKWTYNQLLDSFSRAEKAIVSHCEVLIQASGAPFQSPTEGVEEGSEKGSDEDEGCESFSELDLNN